MKTKNTHFLDTNIILSVVLPNDSSYENSRKYFNHNYMRIISNTACSESEKKIIKIRRISLKIVECAKNYSQDHQINTMKMNRHIFEVKNGFLKQYEDNEYPEDMKKEKFITLVSDFFKNYELEINNLLMTGNADELNNIIISSFRISITKLINFLKTETCITFIENANKYDSLINIGLHKTDAILLEESYCLHTTLNEIIFFITFDGGILDLSDKIRVVLNSKINVYHPDFFT